LKKAAVPVPLPACSAGRRKRNWEVEQDRQRLSTHPFVRPAPSFRPDLRHSALSRAAAVKDGRSSGHRFSGAEASLTAASTTASSAASGADRHLANHQQAKTEAHQKKKITLKSPLDAPRGGRNRPARGCSCMPPAQQGRRDGTS
jgi:hypothetical protein